MHLAHGAHHGHQAQKTGFQSMAGNICLAIAKGAAGIIGNSQALLADAIESTADVFASALVWLGIRYSSRPADKNHPYGHGRVEPLITFLVVGLLVTAVIFIIIESVESIRSHDDPPEWWTLLVLAAIIVIKESYFQVIIRQSRKLHSTSLRAEAWHHRSDAITSVVAFIGISLSLVLGKGFESLDEWAAILSCFVILFNAYKLFRPALGEIMDEDFYEDLVSEIRTRSQQVAGVIDTEKCHIRKTGMTYHVDLHIVVDANLSVRQGHQIAHNLKNHLKSLIPQLADVLIHVEPNDEHMATP